MLKSKSQTIELTQLRNNITAANNELVELNQKLKVAKDGLSEAKKVLEDIAAGNENPKAQAQRVLPRVTAAAKAANASKAEVSQTPKPPTPEIKTDSSLPPGRYDYPNRV